MKKIRLYSISLMDIGLCRFLMLLLSYVFLRTIYHFKFISIKLVISTYILMSVDTIVDVLCNSSFLLFFLVLAGVC